MPPPPGWVYARCDSSLHLTLTTPRAGMLPDAWCVRCDIMMYHTGIYQVVGGTRKLACIHKMFHALEYERVRYNTACFGENKILRVGGVIRSCSVHALLLYVLLLCRSLSVGGRVFHDNPSICLQAVSTS